jgi:hypothetical protein
MASAVLLLLALASYPGSLINFGLFLPLYAAALLIAPASRREGFLVLAGSAVVAGVVLLAVYLEFLGVFLTDMLPRFLAGESRAGSFGLLPAVAMLFHRLWIFYDGLYIPLIASGLFLWMRKRTGLPRGFLICWGVVFLLLIFMRSAMPDLFSRVKEMLWVAPLVSLLSAEALAGVRRSLPAGRLLAPLYFFLLAAYGVGYYAALIGERFALAR